MIPNPQSEVLEGKIPILSDVGLKRFFGSWHLGHLGHVGRLEHVGQLEDVGQLGHLGQLEDVGHLGHLGHLGHVEHLEKHETKYACLVYLLSFYRIKIIKLLLILIINYDL